MAAVSSFVVDEGDLEGVQGEGDTATVCVAFDAANGCERLEQRLIHFGPGRSAERTLADQQEVLYIVDGRGRLHVDGRTHELEPNMGVYLAPGETYAVENPGPEDLHVLSVLAPEDRAAAAGERRVTVRFDDQPELEASVERSFRYLVNEDAGCFAASTCRPTRCTASRTRAPGRCTSWGCSIPRAARPTGRMPTTSRLERRHKWGKTGVNTKEEIE